jgi:hypothetical protein
VQQQYIDDLARSVSPDAAARVFGKPKA